MTTIHRETFYKLAEHTALRSTLVRCGFLFVPGFGTPVDDITDGVHNALLRVAEALGTPSERDGGSFVWDVKPRHTNYVPTFSERAGEALPHTDSSYWKTPERWVLLYCKTPARDGGESSLVDSCSLITRLAVERPYLLSQLKRSELSWPTPVAFSRAQPPGHYPVMSDAVFRFRDDSLASEQVAHPWIGEFRELVLNTEPVFFAALGHGDLLLCDNWRFLHARQHFTDPNRHYLRVRVHET